MAAGLAVARVSRAARAAAGFDLVAAVAHETLAAGSPFAYVRDERNLDGGTGFAGGARAASAATSPITKMLDSIRRE